MIRRILLIAPIIPMLAACATFNAAAEEVTPQQSAAIEATCTKIMRLQKGEAEFEACVSSLSDTVSYEVRADIADVAYSDCAQQGLKRDTTEFSRCVLDSENSKRVSGAAPDGAAARLNAAYVSPADSDPHSYLETSNTMRRRREEYSCAQVGLQPDTGGFLSCVSKLDMDIFVSEHP